MDEKRDSNVADVTWWAWPCRKKGGNIVAAERCQSFQDASCHNCPYLATSLSTILEHIEAPQPSCVMVEVLPDYPVCIGSCSMLHLKKCPAGLSSQQKNRQRVCPYRQTYKGPGRKRSLCLYHQDKA